MALDGKLRERIKALVAELRFEVFGPEGYPAWGRKFVDIEEQTAESEESPRSKVAEALRYLDNQKTRMHYDEYRRQGLPITSSHIESTIKQINRRVKGTEKFWSGRGAEALLQLAADYLSETKPLTTFWRERPSHATGQRRYHAAS